MKVVLFCGGQGTRLRDYSETIPKPMVPIGYRPILWNIMKYYAHYGYKDFILALGYKADYIKNYFINYDERVSNDFVMSWGGKKVDMLSTDIEDWRITFVDTGFSSNVGMRLMRVRKYLEGEEMFMANYADGLSDMYLPDHVDNFMRHPDKVGTLVTYPASSSNFHTLIANDQDKVKDISPISKSGFRLNTGYFIFRKEVFDYINYGEDLNDEPLHRLINERKLIAYRHDGFWKAMDTFKDKMALDALYKKGDAPWEVWKEDFDPSQFENAGTKMSFETQNS